MSSKLLQKNVGSADRVIRVLLGLALLSLLFIGPVPGWGLVGLVGLVPLVTALLGSCPLYSLFGFSTCPMRSSTKP